MLRRGVVSLIQEPGRFEPELSESPSNVRISFWPEDGVPSPEEPLRLGFDTTGGRDGQPTRWLDIAPAYEAPMLNGLRGRREEPARPADDHEPVFESLSDVLGTRLALPMVSDLRRHEHHL